jgi:DNA adenine methylase
MTAAPEMKIKALAPWFGGKRNLAPWIVAELGPHSCYWEPFCGSMAVLLSKPIARMETVNDLNRDIYNLGRCLADAVLAPGLYRRLRRELFGEAFQRDACARLEARPLAEIPDPQRAGDYMIASWQGRNGTAGTTGALRPRICTRYTTKGGHAAKRWTSVVESIPAWRRRLRHVSIENKDGFDLITRIPDEAETAIYCDPPYLQKGASYLHDFAAADHRRLADILGRFKLARVVVSYYQHEKLAELYPGWTCVEIEVSKAMANQGSRGAKDVKATEVLLINGPSLTQPQMAPTAGLFSKPGGGE